MGPSSVVVVIERLVDSLQLRASRFVADQAGNGRIISRTNSSFVGRVNPVTSGSLAASVPSSTMTGVPRSP